MTSYVNLNVLKQLFNYLKNYNNNEENQILEPFSTLIKIAIIGYKPFGTKIAISNNKLYIQEPSVLQGLRRSVWSNKREEIHFLLKPVMRCTELFPPDDSDELTFIYAQAINGLKHLKNTYNNESSTVCHTLDLYISILEQKQVNKSVHIHSYDEINDLALSVNTKINLKNIFDGIWDKNDIILISNLFKSISHSSGINNNSYLKSIEQLIKAKEHIIDDKIHRLSQII